MRKKYLSALLFGALLVTSAGTFTSCKDYDDDINNLQEQITANADAIKKLQEMIGDGKFVTNIVAENNGLKITWNDGNSTVIENVINGEAQQGDVVSIDPETGEIKINNEGTGFFASKGEDEEEVKLPYVNEEGILVLVDAEGKEVVTGIRVAPVTAVINPDGSADITIVSPDGTSQTVKVPSAAASVTDLDIIGYANTGDAVTKYPSDPDWESTDKENGFYPVDKGFVAVYAYKVSSTVTNWKGNKEGLKQNDILAAYKSNGLVSRVAPLSVDASEIDFKLVDSKRDKAPLTVSMTPYSNNVAITRAASKNGMYSVDFEYQKDNRADVNAIQWFVEKYGETAKKRLFALSTESGLISKFDIAFRLMQDQTQSINKYFLQAPNEAEFEVDNTAKEIEVNKKYTVLTNDDSFIYDAYLTFEANDVDKWGIQYDKANDPMSFTVTKLPDNLSTKEFTFSINYLTKNGTMKQGNDAIKITVTPRTNLDSSVQLCSEVSHRIVAEDNFFTVSLDEMFKSLGDSKKLQWIRDVDLSNVAFEIKNGNTPAPNSGKADAVMTFTEDAAGKKATTDASKAKYVMFAFSNTVDHLTPETSYVATITFAPKSGSQGEYAGNVINKVTVPLKITIPAFTDLLQKDMNVFDAEGKVASAYMLEGYDWVTANTEATSTYKFNGAFKNLADNTAAGFAFTLTLDNDPNNVIVDSKTSDKLAFLAAGSYNSTTTTSINVNSTNANTVAITLTNADKAKSYGKELIVNLTSATYCTVYNYDDTSFKIKLLSPIKEGKYVANGGAIKITSTGTTIVTAEDVWATTVNDNVKYDLFKTAIKQSDGKYKGDDWFRQDVANVVFSSERIKFIVENEGGEPTDAVVDSTTGAIKEASSISLRSVGNKGDRDKLKITVTDIWGYTLEDEVDVVVE